MEQLTIIIVNYNSSNHINNCLHSIYSQRHITDFKTIVVDNNSTDNSIDHIKIDFPQVRIIENQHNIGFAKANNIAIKSSQSKYILLLNCDTIVLPDSLDIMTINMENSPHIGLLGCQLINQKGSLQESFSNIPSLFTEFLRKNIYNKHIDNKYSYWGKYLYKKYQKEREVDWVTGSCMMLRRKPLEEIGLFDESYFMYFEDVDLCIQMKRRGWKVLYTPAIKIIHLGGISAANNSDKVNLEYRKSQLYFYKKYHSKNSLSLLKYYIYVKTKLHINKQKRVYFTGKLSKVELDNAIKFHNNLLLYSSTYQ